MVQHFEDGGRRALEEEFFARENQNLIKKLQEERSRAENRRQLAEISGIRDDVILNHLIDNNITPLTVIAMTCVPLVLTAWADGAIDSKERSAILKALTEEGVQTSNPAYQLLESWLDTQPGPELFETWKTYIHGLGQSMDKTSYEGLKKHIMKRTRSVAEAAGGFLGLGSKISDSERVRIEQLDKVFALNS